MKVRFVVSYDYDPTRSNKCRARIRVGLPPDPEDTRYIHPVLRDNDRKVAGRTLWSWWGSVEDEENLHFEADEVFAPDWEELERRVSEFIQETLETLKTVKSRNEQMLATLPTEKVIEYEI